VVIVDESHNAETELSVEMLRNLNPSFILDLTATPRNNSNIISFVDALQLKRENMVKLPVIVSNRRDKTETLQSALLFQRKLEAMALAEETRTGRYIRPIVLLQAQPRTGEESATFEKIKQTLVESGIPEEQIKIKTAEINELKDVDLLSRDCPVRFIITVNALKEGWDCPFAYVLASLANKSSAVDVEQIVGRVLRQPYAVQHNEPLLNSSYVFTASNQFLDTLNNIVKGLNRAGFSERDCRKVDSPTAIETAEPAPVPVQPEMFDFDNPSDAAQASAAATVGDEDEFNLARLALPEIACAGSGASDGPTEAEQITDAITQEALQASEEYAAQTENIDRNVPQELEEKMNRHVMKEVFVSEASRIRLPQFFTREDSEAGLFGGGETDVLLEPVSLLEDFRLSQCDTEIQFDSLDADVYEVDVEKTGETDYKASFRKIDPQRRAQFNSYILSLPAERKADEVVNRLRSLLDKFDYISEAEIKTYLRRIVSQMNDEQLRDCLERDALYGGRIKRKIDDLTTIAKKQFVNALEVDRIFTKPMFDLPQFIAPPRDAPAITKSLYTTEGVLNNLETRAINDIANLQNVEFWHRNLENGGFRINGFINHYPDFIVRLKSGKILIIETKGDDRDNSDSVRKLKLGQSWANKASNDYRYLMIFDNKQIDGAHRLTDAVGLIRQM
jgi:type III restriction enzyme